MQGIARMKQRSDEWYAARLGKVTASNVFKIMTKGQGKTRQTYMIELIKEILTGESKDFYVSREMRRGIELEDSARQEYEIREFRLVNEVGFILHPKIEGFGASPDGFVGKDGLLEIKCPNTETHLDSFLNDEVDQNYIYQMQTQMMCTDRKWCDFVSYDDRLPEKSSYYIKRFNYNFDLARKIEIEVIDFMNELKEKLELLQ